MQIDFVKVIAILYIVLVNAFPT